MNKFGRDTQMLIDLPLPKRERRKTTSGNPLLGLKLPKFTAQKHNTTVNRKKMIKRPETSQSNTYKVRSINIVDENGNVKCPAFPFPLMDLGLKDYESDDSAGRYDEWKEIPAIVSAKKKWMKLFQIIMD